MDAGAAAAMIAAFTALVALMFAARSAHAAKQSAEHAEAIARIEREQRHEMLSPVASRPLPFKVEIGDLVGSRNVLFGTFVVPRDYRVRTLRYGVLQGDEVAVSDIGLVRAHHRFPMVLEEWPDDRVGSCPTTTAVRILFWPPRASDETGDWSCLCGRPEDDSTAESGHWEVYIRLPATDVTAMMSSDWMYEIGYSPDE